MPLLTYTLKPIKRQAKVNNLSWPETGQAALGSLNDGLLASSTIGQLPQPIASIAKVITALAVLNKQPIIAGTCGTVYTLTNQDVAFYEYYRDNYGSNIAVEAGEQLSEYQALEALLLPSANNIADTLVTKVFGSTDEFLIYANKMIKGYGLTNTTITDASGFSASTKSTAEDLITIGQKALQNETIKTIVAETSANLPVAGTIQNVNALLGTNNIIGIKTGNSSDAGGCLLYAATHQLDANHSVTIIGSILGSDNLSQVFSATTRLLISSQPAFTKEIIIKKNVYTGSIQSAWGQKTDIIIAQELSAYGWNGTKETLKTLIVLPYRITEPEQRVGTVSVKTYDGETSVPLLAKTRISPPSVWWRLSHFF